MGLLPWLWIAACATLVFADDNGDYWRDFSVDLPPIDPSTMVLRCRDEVVDTGERTEEGRRVLRLVRSDCRWERIEKE